MGNDGELANDLLLGASTQGARPPLGSSTHDYDGFSVETVDRPEPIRARYFFALLDQIPDSVYRMKGGIRVLAESRELEHVETYSVQAAGAHLARCSRAHGRGVGSAYCHWTPERSDVGVVRSQTS